ncbi:hypothetical protein M409DRAFT_54550 [Zasmidium cellare ATCC 36951]|uniref:AB hydrolase-1 domain-containing protein n=1 Tax=Zasmidium cellare ATCC 36951 TaxID=1080233 RepID=A0A6A6CKS1_ZASCE|nr:uncharacterized protein M409DRAFT_54550 [Zasmidium cellare ATCC 36951]KAF2166760.1 hypothetical protein M409DRAFT_54550 [Zasmidium cellare ATCC 36951]
MLQALQTLFTLRWTQQPQFRPLPSHITRTFVQTPTGPLELLVCEPRKPSTRSTRPAISFVHGGYGCASVWLDWMTYLYEHDYTGRLYAYSVRNHGASHAVSYFQMVFNTSLDGITSDLVACMNHAQELNVNQSMTIVAHSAGGGLAQYALAKGLIRARALCLVDAVPHYGMADLYWNWFKHDPWFPLRSLLHLGHPSSPLYTPALVQGAFFGSKFDSRDVASFMQWMPCYESMGWPIGQFGGFWRWLRGRNAWLDIKDILRHIEVSRAEDEDKDSICLIVGLEDMMYDEGMRKRVANEYRQCIYDLESCKKIDRRSCGGAEEKVEESDINGIISERERGVRVVLVQDAGHHVQNDVQKTDAARALWSFIPLHKGSGV